MQRIADASAVTAQPSTPSLIGLPVGFFTNGTPGVQAPTIVPDWWLNMTQEELCAVLLAAGLPLDGSATLIQAVKALRGFAISQQLIPSSGTLTLPANCFEVVIEGIAAGGGGGSAYGQAAYSVSAGTGGGSGAYFKKSYTASQCGTAASFLIGAAGAGGAAGQNSGTAGGNTTFTPSGSGAACFATGGYGGPFGVTSTTVVRGGFLAGSGNATGGDVNVAGRPGSWPLLFGGSASYQAISGSGGDSVLYPGGQSSQEAAGGNIAKGYGAGGGGGAAQTVSQAGGNGYQGCIIATFFCFNL